MCLDQHLRCALNVICPVAKSKRPETLNHTRNSKCRWGRECMVRQNLRRIKRVWQSQKRRRVMSTEILDHLCYTRNVVIGRTYKAVQKSCKGTKFACKKLSIRIEIF